MLRMHVVEEARVTGIMQESGHERGRYEHPFVLQRMCLSPYSREASEYVSKKFGKMGGSCWGPGSRA